MNSLKELQDSWVDTPESHKRIHELFCEKTNEVPELKELRDWVESHIFGFGERSFYWMFKLLVDELPDNFVMLEVGIFRGQTIAMMRILANLAAKDCEIYGVSPMSNAGGHWDSDYEADVKLLHDTFGIDNESYTIFKGLSTDHAIIAEAEKVKTDLLFIDGSHDYKDVLSDLLNFTPSLKVGGFLVLDDSCCDLQIGAGMFPGIADVTKATADYMSNWGGHYDFLCSVVHNKIYRKIC